MSEVKFSWKALDADEKLHTGEMLGVGVSAWSEIEPEFFKIADGLNSKWLGVRSEETGVFLSGAGQIREYEKVGEEWVRTSADNILPTWLGLTMGVLFVGLPLIGLILWFLGLRIF